MVALAWSVLTARLNLTLSTNWDASALCFLLQAIDMNIKEGF